MNRLLFIIFLSAFSVFSYAQKVTGSFAELRSYGKAKIEVDFSMASIHGMTEEDFSKYETDWLKDKGDISGGIVFNVIDKTDNYLVYGSNQDTPFIVKIVVLEISKKGSFLCDLMILKSGDEVASIKKIRGGHDKLGSKLHLIKQGAESVGKSLGTRLRSALYKTKERKNPNIRIKIGKQD